MRIEAIFDEMKNTFAFIGFRVFVREPERQRVLKIQYNSSNDPGNIAVLRRVASKIKVRQIECVI